MNSGVCWQEGRKGDEIRSTEHPNDKFVARIDELVYHNIKISTQWTNK